jgi:ribosomal protein S18 acetylase RimI-like enzyme
MFFSKPQMRTDAAPVERLGWDSEHFGREIARVRYEGLTPAVLETAVRQADRSAADCLYLLVPASDIPLITSAEALGFRCVDVRLTLTAEISDVRQGGESNGVRNFRQSDLARVIEIARAGHSATRFFRDPHFSRPDCQRLYERWIERSCAGWASFVLVGERQARADAYITCHQAGDGASIGLLAVSEEAQGMGMGAALVAAACARARRQGASGATVITQGANQAAYRLYQRLGFRLKSVELWFHRWRQ